MNPDVATILDPLVLKPGDIIVLKVTAEWTAQEYEWLDNAVRARGIVPVIIPPDVEVVRLEREA